EASQIVVMAARRNEDVRGIVDRELSKVFFPTVYIEDVGLRKALAVCVLDPVVNQRDLESYGLGCVRDALSDVAGAENVKQRIGKNRLHVHLHDSAAQQTAFFGVNFRQIEAQQS